MVRHCYKCKQHTYFRKDYCYNPSCPRKGYKWYKKHKQHQTTSSWNTYNGGGGGGSGSGGGSSSFGGYGSWPNDRCRGDGYGSFGGYGSWPKEWKAADAAAKKDAAVEEEATAKVDMVKRLLNSADDGEITIVSNVITVTEVGARDGKTPDEPDVSAGPACSAKRKRPDADAVTTDDSAYAIDVSMTEISVSMIDMLEQATKVMKRAKLIVVDE